jgi:acyl-CoA thioesterase
VTSPSSLPAATRTSVNLDGSWAIGDKIHGGYLLMQVVRTALEGGAYPHPIGVSAHFASAPDPGPADVDIEPLRFGRRVGVLRARLSQGGVVRAEVLISAGTLSEPGEPRYVDPGIAAPKMPAPEDCERSVGDTPSGARIGHVDHLDMRLDPATSGWTRHVPTGEAVVRAWIRPGDDAPIDPYWLLVAGDAPPPVTFNLGMRGWVPTVTMDVQIRSLPKQGWLILEQSAKLIADGWLDETCNLWDETGRLVASVRQLAGYRD